MSKFKKGDLCYIPQDVSLWRVSSRGTPAQITKTDQPLSALIIEEQGDSVLLYVEGQKLLAPRRHVYPWSA